MVYRGRPSKGCQTCRQRKIKCDRAPSGCENCLKAQFPCPGYRNELDLIFHNENEKVITKFKARNNPSTQDEPRTAVIRANCIAPSKREKRSGTGKTVLDNRNRKLLPRNTFLQTVRHSRPHPTIMQADHEYITAFALVEKDQSEESEIISISPTPPYLLAPSIEDLSKGFFFYKYVFAYDSSSGTTNVCDEPADDSLVASIRALGTAGISVESGAPDLKDEAGRQYLVALHQTNAALRSATEVKKDKTLQAVMLLGIFETVTGSKPQSLTAWSNHVHGAAALLKFRGPEQFDTVAGGMLFLQTMVGLTNSCMQRGMPVPEHVHTMRIEARNHLKDPEDPIWHFTEAMMFFTDFWSNVKQQIITDPETILKRGKELDEEFVSIFAGPPSGWEYHTVTSEDDVDIIFARSYHVYRNYLMAQMWNAMRCFRLMIHGIICGLLRDPDRVTGYDSQERLEQLQSSGRVVLQLQYDILASVPQHLGYKPAANESRSTDNTPSLWSQFATRLHCPFHTSVQSGLPIVRLGGGFTLQWPLHAAALMETIPGPVRPYCIKILRLLNRNQGVRQAELLATILEAEAPERKSPWRANEE